MARTPEQREASRLSGIRRRHADPEHAREIRRAWYLAHKEEADVKRRASAQARYWADPEKGRAKGRTDMAAAYARGRRTRPAVHWSGWLKYRYGITPEQWHAMYDAQGGLCGICHRPQGDQRLCIDHDHATGRVRGLLCHDCNRQVGRVEALRSGTYRLYEDWIDHSPRIRGEGGHYRDRTRERRPSVLAQSLERKEA